MHIKCDIFNVLIPQNSCFINISDDRDILTGQAAHLHHKSLDLLSMMTQRGEGKRRYQEAEVAPLVPLYVDKQCSKASMLNDILRDIWPDLSMHFHVWHISCFVWL